MLFREQFDAAARVAAREAAVRYACESNALWLSTYRQWGISDPPDEAAFIAELACVTAAFAFICWAGSLKTVDTAAAE